MGLMDSFLNRFSCIMHAHTTICRALAHIFSVSCFLTNSCLIHQDQELTAVAEGV